MILRSTIILKIDKICFQTLKDLKTLGSAENQMLNFLKSKVSLTDREEKK